MKYVLAFTALLALVGFVGFTHAKEAKPKVHKGHVVKVEDKSIVIKGGAKGTGKEYTFKTDDNTKVTLDGKDIKLADLKADTYVEITETNELASAIAASTVVPTKKPK